jgi:hypothetical protein
MRVMLILLRTSVFFIAIPILTLNDKCFGVWSLMCNNDNQRITMQLSSAPIRIFGDSVGVWFPEGAIRRINPSPIHSLRVDAGKRGFYSVGYGCLTNDSP